MRRLTRKTDPLGRVTLFDWCRCGALKSLTDPMGRTTSWLTDVQGRRTAKRFADGSQINYIYENTTSRLAEVIDEKNQSRFYTYNLDSTIQSIACGDAAVATPPITFTYDPNYSRPVSMTDGIGTTTYNYNPITVATTLGAGRLGSVIGPLTNDMVTYVYDELGRAVRTSINGVTSTRTFDPGGRVVSVSNALGAFTYAYDGSSMRLISQSDPNGLVAARSYGNNLQDFALQQISHAVGATPISQFNYGRDIPKMQITTWSQQAGVQSPSVFTLGYDAANQLLSATVTNSGLNVGNFAYSYDRAGNRLTELAAGVTTASTYNALNQLSTTANAAVNSRTNEWDAEGRLTAVNAGNSRTEFAYDAGSRLAYIRQLQNGSETSFRRFVWCGGRICEERDKTGAIVIKRFYAQGVKLETGTNAGSYYYTRDHLGSIRELTDSTGMVRVRYAYDPWGRRTKITGDLDADFGFAGMFWSPEVNLAITHFRDYDPELGRWLSRDPLHDAEMKEGPNLYAYVQNSPVRWTDPLGLGFDSLSASCIQNPALCSTLAAGGAAAGGQTLDTGEAIVAPVVEAVAPVAESCASALADTVPPALANTAPQVGVVAQQLYSVFPLGNIDPRILADPRFPDFLEMLNKMATADKSWLTPELLADLAEFDGLTTEYLDELREFVNNGSITFQDAMRWAYQMAEDQLGEDPFVHFP